MTVAPEGTGVDARGPAAVMRPSAMTTTLSTIGVPPLPSISVAPLMAVTALGCDAPNVVAASHRQMQTIPWRMTPPS
jgi:hypothetical protein